jgi:hypothetical protein
MGRDKQRCDTMSRYYLFIKDNELYKTTSNDLKDVAINTGYKYVGMATGKNVSVDGFLFNFTKEEKEKGMVVSKMVGI